MNIINYGMDIEDRIQNVLKDYWAAKQRSTELDEQISKKQITITNEEATISELEATIKKHEASIKHLQGELVSLEAQKKRADKLAEQARTELEKKAPDQSYNICKHIESAIEQKQNLFNVQREEQREQEQTE